MSASPHRRYLVESESSTDTEQEVHHHWHERIRETPMTSGALIPHSHHHYRHVVRPGDSEGRPGVTIVQPSPVSRPSHSGKHRSRSKDRSVYVDVINNVNDLQTVEDHQSLYSRSPPRSRSRSVSTHHRPSRSERRVRRGHTLAPHPSQISAEWPLSWTPPYLYPYPDLRPSWPGPHTWKSESNSNAEANAMAICAVRGRSPSPHHHHHHQRHSS